MRMTDRILSFLMGRDMVMEHARLDAEIEANRAEIRQNTQAIQSGVRLVQTMSGALQMQSERYLADDLDISFAAATWNTKGVI